MSHVDVTRHVTSRKVLKFALFLHFKNANLLLVDFLNFFFAEHKLFRTIQVVSWINFDPRTRSTCFGVMLKRDKPPPISTPTCTGKLWICADFNYSRIKNVSVFVVFRVVANRSEVDSVSVHICYHPFCYSPIM